MVIGGSSDRVVSPGESVRLARLIRGARFELFRDAGHMLPMERSTEVAGLILQFAEDVDRRVQTAERIAGSSGPGSLRGAEDDVGPAAFSSR